jgi:hypothetical protein
VPLFVLATLSTLLWLLMAANYDSMASSRMPAITALLHTCNDEARIGRALESLHPFDEVLIVDHGSADQTVRIARNYGAAIRIAQPDLSASVLAAGAKHSWIFCLRPTESLSENLEASLYEWKLYDEKDVRDVKGAAVHVREESSGVWTDLQPEARLVRKTWDNWNGFVPADDRRCMMLQGDLLRFQLP